MYWNYIIYGVVILQAIALVVLAVALLKLKNGPVMRSVRRGMKLVRLGKRLGTSGVTAFGKNQVRVMKLVQEVKGIAEGVQHGTRTDFGDEISYRSLLAGWASLQSGLGSAVAVLGFLQGLGKKKNTPAPATTGKPTKPARPTRRSLVDRMGLVPPIAKPLGRVVNYGRIAWEIRNELKRRGIGPF